MNSSQLNTEFYVQIMDVYNQLQTVNKSFKSTLEAVEFIKRNNLTTGRVKRVVRRLEIIEDIIWPEGIEQWKSQNFMKEDQH